jgi:hypothetical protein
MPPNKRHIQHQACKDFPAIKSGEVRCQRTLLTHPLIA